MFMAAPISPGLVWAGIRWKWLRQANVSICLNYNSLPIIEEAEKFADMGIVPSGTYHNRNHCQGDYFSELSILEEDIVFDPQTSGGLLISLNEDQGNALLSELSDRLGINVRMIGRVETKNDFFLYLKK